MQKLVLTLVALASLTLYAVPQPPPALKQAEPDFSTYGRGYKTPPNIAELVAKSWEQHGRRLSSLPKVTAPKWDCRDLGLCGPIRNQGSCGSCWDVSACDVLDSAFIKAGHFKNDGSQSISDQYVLDNCGPRNGGCNGDWSETVTTWCRDHGLPTTQEYGPYVARTQRCKQASYKLWKIDSQGYCASKEGVAPTQAIKDAIATYGPVSAAVDAGGFNSYRGGIMQGDGNNVDHAISIVGWDDTKGTGCWLVRNQWGTSWGEKGYAWIPYTKWSIGYSALWVHATPVDPPSPTPPVPPGPTPPSPEPPIGAVTITVPKAGTYHWVSPATARGP